MSAAEPALPMPPNPYLVQRYTAALQLAEMAIPTGDPGAVRCGLVLGDGTTCGQGRYLVGPSGQRVLMCPTCDQPTPSGDLLNVPRP